MPAPTRNVIPPTRIPASESFRTNETSVSGGMVAAGGWVSWVTLVLLPRSMAVGLFRLLLQPLGHRVLGLRRQVGVDRPLAQLQGPDVRRDPPPVLGADLRPVFRHRPVPAADH